MRKHVITLVLVLSGVGVFLGALSFIAEAQTLGTPGNLAAIPVSSCAFKVSWVPAEGADAYDVERNRIAEVNIATADEGGGKVFTDEDGDALWSAEDARDHIDPGESYSYRVRAKNTVTGAQSEWSSEASATALALPPKPESPKNVAVVFNQAAGRIELQWDMNAPISNLFQAYGGFEIWRAASTNGGNSFGPLARIGRPPSSQRNNEKFFYYDVEDVTGANAYRYVVKTQETGGEGCNPLRAAHVAVSDGSSAAVVPSAPDKLTVDFSDKPRKITLNWRDNSKGEANEVRFEILRSKSESFSADNTLSAPYVVGAGVTRYEDGAVEQGGTQIYWYKARGCTETACSAYSAPVAASTGLPAPYGLKVSPSFTDPTTVGVNVFWKVDLVLSGTEFWMGRRVAGGNPAFTEKKVNEGNCGTAVNACRDLLVRGENYEYRIRASRGGTEVYSETIPFNANLTAVKGWVWSGNGLGWIRLSNDSANSSWGPAKAPAESVPYGIYLDGAGTLAGYAWSPYAGWLSFNKGDLAQCPSGACEAKVAAADAGQRFRTVTGWAKFMGDGKGNGLGQFVSLSPKSGEPSYKLVYATTTDGAGEFRGFAWGGDTAGWLSFGGPILKDVRPLPGGTSVEVEWENPISYKKIFIERQEKTLTADYADKLKYRSRLDIFQGNLLLQGSNKTAVITGLDPDTEYAFFVRGELKP
ncbi:MAG: hypothetical protein HYU81_02705 [Candidatus Brennerbacteria bacterium]|nr:hypothetical protein [Candidatus Brennerbacteria bacterium]